MPLVVLSLCLSLFAHGQEPAVGFTRPPGAETVVLPKSVPDPIEPFNRVMWGFNKGLMTGVIKPTSRVYRFVVVKSVRTDIGNFGRNLTYPGRAHSDAGFFKQILRILPPGWIFKLPASLALK